MNRPRHSVLAQFDPLLSDDPVEDSDNEYDSEKENASPDQFAIFNRNHKRDHAIPALSRRLVDVGDVTIQDASIDEEDESENSYELQTPKRRPDPKLHGRTVTPRTPLAEISLDRELSPLPRKMFVKREFPLKQSPEAGKLPSSSSSLSSLIDAVNLAGTSFARSHLTVPPEIKIQSSEPSLGSSLIQETPPPFDMAASIAIPRSDTSFLIPPVLRTSPPSASQERSRYSLDLDASFNLQASETSFDLLNDKISFLDDKSISFSNADETILESDENQAQEVAYNRTEQENVTPTQQVYAPKLGSPAPIVETKRPQTVSTPIFASENQPPADLAQIVSKQPLATPAAPRNAAPTIPALRIVKRAKRLERPGSSIAVVDAGLKKSPPSSDSETSSASSRSGSSARKSTSSSSSASSTATRQSSPPSPVFKAVRCPGGPMRIPVSESSVPGAKAAAAGTSKNTAPVRPGSGLGPRRVPLPELSNQEPIKANSKPVRPAAAKTSLSSVPRPASALNGPAAASRLPAPSGIARRKPMPSSTTVPVAGSNVPTRGPVRRYGFGQ